MAGDRWKDDGFIDGLEAAGLRVHGGRGRFGSALVRAGWQHRLVVVDALQGCRSLPGTPYRRPSGEFVSESGLDVRVTLEWTALLVASSLVAAVRAHAPHEAVADGSWGQGWSMGELASAGYELLDSGVFASELPDQVRREELAGQLLVDTEPGRWPENVTTGELGYVFGTFAERLLSAPMLVVSADLLAVPAGPPARAVAAAAQARPGAVPRGF